MGGYLPKLRRRVETVGIRFRKRFEWATSVAAALAKGLVVLGAFWFVYLVFRDAYRPRNVVFIDISVPKALEDRGYTSQAVGDRVRNEIDNIRTKLLIKDQSVTAAEGDYFSDSDSLPEIEVPKTGVSYRDIVRFVQDALNIKPRRITGEITCVSESAAKPSAANSNSPAQPSAANLCIGDLMGTVRITNSTRTSMAPTFEVTPKKPDPELLMPSLAESVVRLIDPYLLALHADEIEKTPDKEMQFINECDGKLAKWGWLQWGWILVKNHDYDGAAKKFNEALRIDPDFKFAYIGRSLALNRQSPPNSQGAIKMCKKALGHYRIGIDDLGYWMYEKSARSKSARLEELARTLLGNDPAEAFAYYNWGNALSTQQDPDLEGAVYKYKEALVIDPRLATYHNKNYRSFHSLYELGERQEKQHRWPEALAAYCAYHRFQPNDRDGDQAIDNTIEEIPIPDLKAAYANFERSRRSAGSRNVEYVLGRMRTKLARSKTLTANAERQPKSTESEAGLAAIQPAN